MCVFSDISVELFKHHSNPNGKDITFIIIRCAYDVEERPIELTLFANELRRIGMRILHCPYEKEMKE